MNFRVVAALCLVSSVLAVEVPHISRPVIKNVMGRYLNHPGLAFQPNPTGASTLIRFNKARPSTYQQHYDSLLAATSAYRPELHGIDQGVIDCQVYREYRPREDWDRPCRVDPTFDLGPDCVKQQSFGYEDGQPCVLFNLERVYHWLPVPYDSSSVPDNIRDLWSEYSVTLKCEGADAPSRENMGTLTYYPNGGFHFKYFPDMGQPLWKSPLVFVRFENPWPAVLIRVECKVYASNIWQTRILNTGMVSFELLVD